jgi:hypothetical protein
VLRGAGRHPDGSGLPCCAHAGVMPHAAAMSGRGGAGRRGVNGRTCRQVPPAGMALDLTGQGGLLLAGVTVVRTGDETPVT